MAYDAYCQFIKSSKTGGTPIVAELDKKGQHDGLDDDKLPKNCDTKAWFNALHVAFEGSAQVNASKGTSAGGVQLATIRIVKPVGALTGVTVQAFGDRATFDFLIKLMAPGKGSKDSFQQAGEIKLTSAVIQSHRFFTGDSRFGSLGTSDSAASGAKAGDNAAIVADTRELEELVLVYQQFDFHWLDGTSKKNPGKFTVSGAGG